MIAGLLARLGLRRIAGAALRLGVLVAVLLLLLLSLGRARASGSAGCWSASKPRREVMTFSRRCWRLRRVGLAIVTSAGRLRDRRF